MKKTKTQTKEEIRRIVKSHLHDKNWDILYRLEIELEETPNLVEAGINKDTWMINQTIDPEIENKLEELLKKENAKIKYAKEKLLCAAADHEEGHWSICPYDRDNVEDILHGVATGLKNAGLNENEAIQNTPEVANVFMDYIDNSGNSLNAKDGKEFSEGIGLFYLNQIRMPECTPDYLLFVEAQMKTFGKRMFRTMAEKDPQITTDAKKLVATVIPQALSDKAFDKGLDEYDAKLVLEEINKKELWDQKSQAFAEIYAQYLKQRNQNNNGGQNQQQNNNGQQNGSQGQTGNQNTGQNSGQEQNSDGQGEQNNSGKDQNKEEKGEQEGHDHKNCKKHKHKNGKCSFVKDLMEDPEAMKEIIKRAIQKGREAGPAGIPYATKQQIYETAYEAKAEEIVLKYFKEDDETENPALDLFYMQNEMLDEEKLEGKINWSKTIFTQTPEGQKPILFKKEIPYQIEEEVTKGRKRIEDILFIVDVSGSMGWTQHALDGSKYDLALQSIFGCLKGLEKMGRAAHAKYGIVLFSNSTEFSGWEDYYGLDRFKKIVFEGYQGGGTHLNPNIMQKALEENKDKFLTILITDGEISNNKDASETIKKIIEKGNDVVQFSIEGNTTFSQEIQKHGAQIVNVNKPEDLMGVVLEKMKERYL